MYNSQVFPGSARAGNITLEDHSVTYQFRVSASIMVGQSLNEGELSFITANTDVFIPEPGKVAMHGIVDLYSRNTESEKSLSYSYIATVVSYRS